MKRRLMPALLALALALQLTNCAPRRLDGYRPPIAQDPFAAYAANWEPLEAVSGAYALSFRYSDGKKVSLTANMVVEREMRVRVDLSSDRGAEAIVILTPELINLVNMRDRYHMREKNSPENADRMVGFYLAPREMAALLSGRGFDPERFPQIYTEPAEGGGLYLDAFHGSANLKVDAYVDAFGRLRSVRYIDALTDRPIVEVRYFGFRLDRRTAIVWPGRVEINLLRRGEMIAFRARDVDINPMGLDMDFIFTPRARGDRLLLEDVPPGPPLLYRSAKEYVR